MTNERRIDRMRGCTCLGKLVLGVTAAALAVYCVLNLHQCFFMTDQGGPLSGRYLQTLTVAKDLRISIESYKDECHAFPIPVGDKTDDSHLRSRGQLVTEIFLFDGATLNFKRIKFIDLPMARNRKFGLWQDGSEWVLSDVWGEPYYIILDTNEDNVITNPDPDAAKSLSQIPARVLIYSSGPDRDPKTWHDNICSWKQ